MPWFGRDTDAAIARLRFLADVGRPGSRHDRRAAGPLDVLAMAAQGITMGDDLHMRTQAGTNLLTRAWLPHIAALPDGLREPFADFLAGNHLFFLDHRDGRGQVAATARRAGAGSSIVTTMSRNGTTFGIKLAGSAQLAHLRRRRRWVRRCTTPGSGPRTSARDIGDSARCWS